LPPGFLPPRRKPPKPPRLGPEPTAANPSLRSPPPPPKKNKPRPSSEDEAAADASARAQFHDRWSVPPSATLARNLADKIASYRWGFV
jgi:hypothetical protein